MASAAAEILCGALVADAQAHQAGRYDDIGERYDDVYVELLRIDGLSERPVRIALDFWDGWIDARNHDWLYYDGIEEHDWPRHARVVSDSDCLRFGRVPDVPSFQAHFARPPEDVDARPARKAPPANESSIGASRGHTARRFSRPTARLLANATDGSGRVKMDAGVSKRAGIST
jgi:hypothetical protein